MPRTPTSPSRSKAAPKKPSARKPAAPKIHRPDPTTAWAEDVASGKIIAGELVIASATRHINDRSQGHKRGLAWNPDKADHALNFPPAVFTISEGAKAGHPFTLLPWHTFCVGSLFGWRKASGRMRFRSGWLETGKGQAKSPLMAVIGLYMMGFYGVPRAKVFAIGQDRNTANVLFRDAAAMCRGPIPGYDSEDGNVTSLESTGSVILRGEHDNVWKIEHPATGSLFQALANGEAISGPRPILVTADEIHEFKSGSSIETWKRAIAKMPGDALMLLGTNTPASNQLVGTEYSEYYQRVVKGEIVDDEAFAFIARVDEADRETVFDNEACWQKALPALGITFPVENIRGEVNTAKQLLSTALSVKRLYFGIPTGVAGFWIAEEAWKSAQGPVEPDDMRGLPCWLSLDLSQKNDLTALTAMWRLPDGRLVCKTWYWTVKDGLADRGRAEQVNYEAWAEGGWLTVLQGATVDKTFVAAQVQTLCAEHSVQFLAFDPAGMADFVSACDQIGFSTWKYAGPDEPEGRGLKLVSHSQGTRVMFEDRQLCMPRSVEKLEDAILNDNITIENSPLTYWCAGNAIVISDGQNNRAFDKKRSRGRIDGLVTIAMGVGAAQMAEATSSMVLTAATALMVI